MDADREDRQDPVKAEVTSLGAWFALLK